jgi:hypothetical protein
MGGGWCSETGGPPKHALTAVFSMRGYMNGGSFGRSLAVAGARLGLPLGPWDDRNAE